MSTSPFFTDLDSRAEVKGSVDPLGAMAIWSRLGRRVVGNLSTVTSSVRDFKTLVLGFGLLKELRRRAGPDSDVDELAAFLRWEQLAAYTRGHLNNDFDFRGVRRVQRQLNGGAVVPISAERDCQILGNQKTYGLWGLFTVPARASGLLEREVSELTPEAESFVDRFWRPSLSPIWKALLDTVSEDTRRFNLEKHDGTLRQLRKVWTKSAGAEREFWVRHLVRGGGADRTDGKQAVLAKVLAGTDNTFELSQAGVQALAATAGPSHGGLADDLLDIAACESVLASAASLFGYLQTLDGQPIGKAIDGLKAAWGADRPRIARDRFAGLRDDMTAASGLPRMATEWIDLSGELDTGDWEAVVPRLLTINKLVMDARGGAAWIADEGGTLRVRYRDEADSLPDATELPRLWRNTYFLTSLRDIVKELEVA
jgi:hypothetical protein